MATLDTDSYAIGTPDVFFNNTATKTAGGTVTLASAISDLSALLNAIGNDGSITKRQQFTLGNLPECSIAPEYTTLDHYVSDRGSRKKDKSVITEKNLKVTMSFDEISITNLQRFLMSANKTGGSALMTEVAEEGSAVLVFKTDIGVPFLLAFPRVTLKASGELAFSGEDWMKGSLEMDILALPSFSAANTTFVAALSPATLALEGALASEMAPYGYNQTEADFGTFYVSV